MTPDFSINNVRDFSKDLLGKLYQHEAQNSLLLGAYEEIQRGKRLAGPSKIEFIEFSKSKNSQASAAILWLNKVLLLAQLDAPQIHGLIQHLYFNKLFPPLVLGVARSIDAFLIEWQKLYPEQKVQVIRQNILEAQEGLSTSTTGKMRLAQNSDITKLQKWRKEFLNESHPEWEGLSSTSLRDQCIQDVQKKQVYVWESENEIVAMAQLGKRTMRTITISTVYTEKNSRGQGFAKALVSQLTQYILSQGFQSCLIFTDSQNIKAESLYKKIGYRQVSESGLLHLQINKRKVFSY